MQANLDSPSLSPRKMTAIVILLLFLGVFMIFAHAQYVEAATSTQLSQCANDDNNENPTCTISTGGVGWITGNAGLNKSQYYLGDYLPYRHIHDGLFIGNTYCFGMKWDVTQGSAPAIDYLSTYNKTLPNVDPTVDTVHSGNPADGSFLFPPDPALSKLMNGNAFTGSQPADSALTIWGGTITSVGNYYHTTGDAACDADGNDLGQANCEANSVEYCFLAANEEVLLSWSGHIALPSEWNEPSPPGGSPYHMANGTWVIFTAPRTGQTDFAGTGPGGPTNDNRGRAEIQLAAEPPPPTAITLNNAGLNTGGSGFVLLWIGLLLISGITLMVFKRIQRTH